MTQPAFARAHGLRLNTLRGWLYDPRFLEPDDACTVFLEVDRDEVVEAEPPFRIQVGERPSLTFATTPDPVWLARFVSALPC